MRLFRLCRQKDAELTGYGAKRTGGRWNRKGIFALYTAEHASLAVVEVLVHLDRTEIPSDFVFLEVSVADEYILTLPTAESNEEFLKSVYQTGAEALPPNIVGFSVPSVVVPLHAIAVRADALRLPLGECLQRLASVGELLDREPPLSRDFPPQRGNAAFVPAHPPAAPQMGKLTAKECLFPAVHCFDEWSFRRSHTALADQPVFLGVVIGSTQSGVVAQGRALVRKARMWSSLPRTRNSSAGCGKVRPLSRPSTSSVSRKNIRRWLAGVHQIRTSGVRTRTFSGRISGRTREPRPCASVRKNAVDSG